MTQLNLPQTNQPQIQEFQFQTNPLRIVEHNGELWFIAVDVCNVLGLGNTTNALKRLDDDEYALILIKGITKGNEMTNLVNESGFYSLALGSRKPVAKEFKRWVTHEVLPTLRKTGTYSVPGAEQARLDTPSTKEDRKPLTNLVNTLVSVAPLTYRDVWHMVHAHENGKHAPEFTLGEVQDACEFVQEKIDLYSARPVSYTLGDEFANREKELRNLYEQFDQNTILDDIDLKNPDGTLGLIFDMKSHFDHTLKVAANYEKILIRLQKFEAEFLRFSLFRKMLSDAK